MKYSFSLVALAAVASAQEFTSIYNITATPDQVVNSASVSTPGQTGARGQYNYAINSKTETICYDITLTGVTGDYQSPARTATHIHEGAKGRAGPPRIALPNPIATGYGDTRRSVGCLTGPFITGIKGADNVTDTGAGFKLAQIEANPAGFFTDSHTTLFVAGVVRGQLDQKFEIIKGAGYPVPNPPKDDGYKITTATYTTSEDCTVTPPAGKPYVTKTAKVYTTVCPISELPHYTKPVVKETKPITYTIASTIKETKGVPTYPAETPKYPVSTLTKPAVTYPAGTAAPTYPAATTTRAQYTGAASANKVGGIMMAVGLAAALL